MLLLLLASVLGWSLNEEREVAPGYYAELVYQADDWKVWKFTGPDGETCRMAKPPAGGQVLPGGFENKLGGSTPFIEVEKRRIGLEKWDIRGEYLGKPKIQVRPTGAKFYFEYYPGRSLEDFTSSSIDIYAETWRYPEMLSGLSRETATIDLTGIHDALKALRACPFPPTIEELLERRRRTQQP